MVAYVRRHWFWFALAIAAIPGGVWAGLAGAAFVDLFAVLFLGPAYLVQKRLQRRRGQLPTGRGLDRDADQTIALLASRYLAVMNRSRGVRILVYAGGFALIGISWLVAGSGLALAILGGALAMTVAAAIRRR